MFPIIILVGLSRFLVGIIYFFLAIILEEKGLTSVQTGFLLSIFTFIPILLSLPSGIMNDRVPSRILLCIALFGNFIFYILFSCIKSFFFLIPLFLLGGICTNLCNISMQSFILKITGQDRRNTKLGLFNGASNIGFAFGTLIGGIILFTRTTSFLLKASAAGFLLLAICALYLKDSSRIKIQVGEYFSSLKDRNVLYFCLIYSIFAIHWGSEISSYSLFLRDYFHLTKYQSAFYISFPILTLGISAILIGNYMDKNSNISWKLTVLAFLCSGLGQIFMVIPFIYISIVMRIIHEIGDGIAATLLLAGMAERFKADRIGGLSSLVTFFNIVSQSVAIFIFTQIGSHYGHVYSIIGGGLSALVPAILIYIQLKNARLTCLLCEN